MHRCRYNPAYWCVYVITSEDEVIEPPETFLKVLKTFKIQLEMINKKSWALDFDEVEKQEEALKVLEKECKKYGYDLSEATCNITKE